MNHPSPNQRQDHVFDQQWRPTDFCFDAQVADVFDDMVSRSVPFYSEIQRMQAELAVSILGSEDSLVYDLGCSTATTLAAIASHSKCPASTRFVGIDNARAMLDEAKGKIESLGIQDRITLVEAEIDGHLNLEPCDIVIMNWTLQFVRPIVREALIRTIANALRPGGMLLLSEKVLVRDSLMNRLYIEFYYDYKRQHGYSDTEIRNKREALENVLIPYRSEENHALLKRSGFETIDPFFRWFNFESVLAIKPRG